MTPARLGTIALLATLTMAVPAPSGAGEMEVTDVGGVYNVRLTTLREIKERRVIRQKFDFSCGSAAVATLLTHHYGKPVSETDVFKDMWERGDQEKIKKEGFSLRDMRGYIERRGFRAGAYRIPLTKVEEAGVPIIVLIKTGNLLHFVVLKGVQPDRVVIADPFQGNRIMDRAEFEAAWNGVSFVLLDDAERGQAAFNRKEDWAVRPRAPVGVASDSASLSGMLLQLPGRGFF